VSLGHQDGLLRLLPAPKAWPPTNSLQENLTREHEPQGMAARWVCARIKYVEQCPGLPIPPTSLTDIKEKP